MNIECEEVGGERWGRRVLFDLLRSLVVDWRVVGSYWKIEVGVWSDEINYSRKLFCDSIVGSRLEGREIESKVKM